MSDALTELNDQLTTLAARVAASTVTIGQRGRGSGVVIGNGAVVTSAHNLRDSTTQVTFPDGTAVQAEVTAVDLGIDIALLAAETGSTPALEWNHTPPQPGGLVVTAAGGNGNPRVAVGNVIAHQQSFRAAGGALVDIALEHSAQLPKGASGGPVVDVNGLLVGINTHRTDIGYLAIPSGEELDTRLSSLREGQSSRPPKLGVAFEHDDTARELRERVGLEPQAGAMIRRVSEGSLAEQAGLRQGDVIVGLGSDEADLTEVGSVRQAMTALRSLSHPTQVVIAFVRGNDRETVTAQR